MISTILSERARKGEGLVLTPDSQAEVMVHEALFFRLIVAIPHLNRTTYSAFLSGTGSVDFGKALVQEMLSYTYLDPAVGEGIFLETLLFEIYRLADRYDLEVPDKWEQNNVTGWDINRQMIRKCREKLPGRPTLIRGDYLFHSDQIKADIILANPPYIRQELIEKRYKQHIRRSIQNQWPDLPLSARSDLYLYFVLKAARDLNTNGVLTFIIPNSWMDNVYGKALRDLFRRHLQLNSLLESDRRHFKVDVNTVILTATNRNPKPEAVIQLITDSHVRNTTQQRVVDLELGWYGSLFRCPDWLLWEIHNNKNLSSLENHFSVSAGIITGNNQKYYRSQAVNGSFARAIRSPRETTSIEFGRANARSWIKTEDIPFIIRKAPLLWTDLRGGRHVVIWNRDNLPFEHTFYGLKPKSGDSIKKWALILNSTWVWLMVEIFGRKGLGGGAIRLVKKDLLKLPIPNFFRMDFPNNIPGFLDRTIENWRTELDQYDRRQLDEIIFKSLNLKNRYAESMKLLKAMMELREQKARG